MNTGWMLFCCLAFPYAVLAEVPAYTPDEYDVCRMVSKKLASVSLSDCVERRLLSSGARSVNNLPILLKEYFPIAGKPSKGRVLVMGGIHGDEYSSVSIMFKWMKILDKYHSGLFHWKIVPLLNPDGLLQRKSQRMNANGVDLNRNFPTPNWAKESVHYWVKRTRRNPRRYPGPRPLSEPETAWLSRQIDDFKPDAIVSVHAPHGIIDFDGPPRPPKRFGQLYLRLLGTYPGSLGNYAGVHKKLPVITIELPHAGIMPSKRETGRIWVDLVRWLKKNVQGKKPIQVKRENQAGPS